MEYKLRPLSEQPDRGAGMSTTALMTNLLTLVRSSLLQLHTPVADSVVAMFRDSRECWVEATCGLSDMAQASLLRFSPFLSSFGDSTRAAAVVAVFTRSAWGHSYGAPTSGLHPGPQGFLLVFFSGAGHCSYFSEGPVVCHPIQAMWWAFHSSTATFSSSLSSPESSSSSSLEDPCSAYFGGDFVGRPLPSCSDPHRK